MTNPSDPAPARPTRTLSGRILASLGALLRTRITTGLLVILPIAVTYYVVKFIFLIMVDSSKWAVEAFFGRVPIVERWAIPIISVLCTIFVLYAVGLFATHVIGRRFIGAFDALVDRLPLIKTVYRAMKQIVDTFSTTQTTSFQRVALVPFPSNELRTVGFITNYSRDAESGDEIVTIFVSTTPNPTTGFVFVTRRRDVVELDWSVEEAVRMVISAGILFPHKLTMLLPEQAAALRLAQRGTFTTDRTESAIAGAPRDRTAAPGQ